MTIQKPEFVRLWNEPFSPADLENGTPPIYPFNNATSTPSGHAFELDDTPTRERIRLQHRTGTFIEMHPNGDEVHKVYGDGYEITIKDKNILIGASGKGNLTVEIKGDVYMNVHGNYIHNVEGDYELTVKGHYTTAVEGQISTNSKGKQVISSAGRLELNTGEGVIPGQGGYININGDLAVRGEFVADKITSTGRIDSALGITSQKVGFSTPFGGLAVGLAYPIPLSINCTGPINSQTMVSAPYITSSLSSTMLGLDTINGNLRNMQFHIAPNGPTSPPTTPEIT